MQKDFALLADGVGNRPDGKIDIFGAGLDTIWTEGLPARHTQLTLVVRLLLSEDEWGLAHTLEVQLSDPSGQAVANVESQVVPLDEHQAPPRASGSPGLMAVLSFAGLVFEVDGQYEFRLLWDGEDTEIKIPLSVALRSPG